MQSTLTTFQKSHAAHLQLMILAFCSTFKRLVHILASNWLRVLRLDWNVIHQLRGGSLQELLECHGEVFQAELGTLRGYEAKIHVDPGVKHRFCKSRTVPYALREKVE